MVVLTTPTGFLNLSAPSRTEKHQVVHLRTTTKTEVRQKQIYDALNSKPDLIGQC